MRPGAAIIAAAARSDGRGHGLEHPRVRILNLHCSYFADLWRREGHDTITCGSDAGHDLQFDGYFVTIEDILASLGRQHAPDVIFWGDASQLVRVLGLERCTIPKVMWSVDTHHHVRWHTLHAQAFDVVFTAQRDYVARFREAGVEAEWLPLYGTPSPLGGTPVDRWHDVSFVGSLDPDRNPERLPFLEAVSARVPLHVTQGAWAETYARSKIVLNHTVRGDLNFRVFEAMSCGSLLVTERTTNGLCDLFSDGVHLVTYPRGDADAAAEQIRRYLGARATREGIAATGWREVSALHRREHRARFLLRVFDDLVAGRRPRPHHDRYQVDLATSMLFLYLGDWMQRAARVSTGTLAALRHERGTQYLVLAREYLALAAAQAPHDPAWHEVAALMPAA
jgi:hypothetical protein